MQPATRAINFSANKLGQDQKHDARQIHRQGAPADPAIINQTRNHECQSAHRDPVCLLSPEICSVGVCPRGSRTVDGHHSKDRKREHGDQQEPVLAKQFSKKRCHAAFWRTVQELRRIIRKLRFWQSSQWSVLTYFLRRRSASIRSSKRTCLSGARWSRHLFCS